MNDPDIFRTTPAEDAENFKRLWLETLRERDNLEHELERLRDGIEDARAELYWRKWNALARRDIPVFREQMDKVYDRLGRALAEQPEEQP